MSYQMIQRAILLLQQQKYKEAEAVLAGLFREDPSNVDVLGLMVELKINQSRLDDALDLVNNLIGLAPSDARPFYQRARISIIKEKLNEAEKDLQQAISLDPYDPDYFALLALLKIERKDFSDALVLADKALELDAENIQALNARSTALLKLNRKEESINTIEGALREDPDNAYTHANYGWGLLEKGSHKEALKHFSESLRKDPNLHLAQAGMAEALKARYLIYRYFLKYSFWISNLQQKYQWAVIIGFYVLVRLVGNIKNTYPSLEPFLNPLLVLLTLVAFSTWIITPIGNLFLRLNKYGKHLLSSEQTMSSNFVGISLAISVAGLIGYTVTSFDPWLGLGVYGLSMMIPLSVMLTPSKNKILLIGYTVLLAVLGLAGLSVWMYGGEMFNSYASYYLFGLVIFQWVANFVILKNSNR